MSTSVRHIKAGEGEMLWFAGAHQTVKHPGAWSEGEFSLVEVTAPRGRATPLHRDPSDETFYLLTGEMLFHADGVNHAAHAGDTVAIKQGVAHAFMVTSDSVRFLVLNTPGTHDSYFRDGGVPATNHNLADAPAPDHARIEASNHTHGVEMLGPPPFPEPLV